MFQRYKLLCFYVIILVESWYSFEHGDQRSNVLSTSDDGSRSGFLNVVVLIRNTRWIKSDGCTNCITPLSETVKLRLCLVVCLCFNFVSCLSPFLCHLRSYFSVSFSFSLVVVPVLFAVEGQVKFLTMKWYAPFVQSAYS